MNKTIRIRIYKPPFLKKIYTINDREFIRPSAALNTVNKLIDRGYLFADDLSHNNYLDMKAGIS